MAAFSPFLPLLSSSDRVAPGGTEAQVDSEIMALHVYGLSVHQEVEVMSVVVGLVVTPQILTPLGVPRNPVILTMTKTQSHRSRKAHRLHQQPSQVERLHRARRARVPPLPQLLANLARRIVQLAMKILRSIN